MNEVNDGIWTRQFSSVLFSIGLSFQDIHFLLRNFSLRTSGKRASLQKRAAEAEGCRKFCETLRTPLPLLNGIQYLKAERT